jgi:hypothetical protein
MDEMCCYIILLYFSYFQYHSSGLFPFFLCAFLGQASGGLRGSKIGNFFGRLTSRNNVGENEKRANVL